MVEDGGLFALAEDTYWIDAGTRRPVPAAQARPARRPPRPRPESISPAAVVAPEAIVERSVIGSGAVVGAQAIVRSSVVMAGAFVGEGATLTDSIVGANARVEAGAVIDGYSVLGDGTRAEPGEHLHAVRRPEEAPAGR